MSCRDFPHGANTKRCWDWVVLNSFFIPQYGEDKTQTENTRKQVEKTNMFERTQTTQEEEKNWKTHVLKPTDKESSAEVQSTMFTKHKQGDGGSKCEFSSNESSSETCDVSAVVQSRNENWKRELGSMAMKSESEKSRGRWVLVSSGWFSNQNWTEGFCENLRPWNNAKVKVKSEPKVGRR